MTSFKYVTALTAAIALSGLALSGTPASAANSAMADCNTKWNAEKAANTTNGATYQDFLKGCLKSAAPAAADAKTTTTKPADAKVMDAKAMEAKAKADAMAAKTTTDTKVKTTAAATAAVTPDKAIDPEAAAKKVCNKEWKALKDAGTEGTQKKKDFVAGCLVKAGIVVPAKATAAVVAAPAATTTTAKTPDVMAKDVTPPDPTDATAKPAMTDTTGKVRTPGQLAMDKRIKECGVLWKQAKTDGKTNGLKWPQYWSKCNTEMKAAGN